MLLFQSSLKSFPTIGLSGIETTLSFFVSWILLISLGKKFCSIFRAEYFLWAPSDACCASISLLFLFQLFLSTWSHFKYRLYGIWSEKKNLDWMSGNYFHGCFSCVALIRAKSYSIQLFSLSRLKSRIRTPVSVASESKCISLNLKIYLSEL